jgi:hypothetical protein
MNKHPDTVSHNLRRRALAELDAFFQFRAGPDAATRPNHSAARQPVWRLDIADIADFHVGCRAGAIDLAAAAPTIRLHEEQLLACIRDPLRFPDDLDDLEEVLELLSGYLAGVFLPAVACRREFDLGLNAAWELVNRVAVLGEGSGQDERFALLMPVFWGLSAWHP